MARVSLALTHKAIAATADCLPGERLKRLNTILANLQAEDDGRWTDVRDKAITMVQVKIDTKLG